MENKDIRKKEKNFLVVFLIFVGIIIVLIATVICIAVFSPSSNNELTVEEKAKLKSFGDITDLINAEKFDEAKVKLEELYKDVSYQDDDGVNKVNQYALFYEKQGKSKEKVSVYLDFLKANEEDIKIYIEKKDSKFFNSSSLKNPTIVDSRELNIITDYFKEHKKDIEEDTYQQVEKIIGELMN